MVQKWFLPIAIILVIAFALSACTPQPATPTTPAPKAPTVPAPVQGPAKGGILKLSSSRPATVFGYPPGIVGTDQNYSKPFFEKLIRKDDKCAYQPELATSWDVAPDGKSITFKLRQGVKFHDGTDFNADAVKFNYDPLLPPKSPILAGISSIGKQKAWVIQPQV